MKQENQVGNVNNGLMVWNYANDCIENVSLIKHVHINDMKDIPAEFCDHNRDRVLPGQGCLDLSSILNRLELHGYCGHFSIEMFSQRLWNLPTEDAAKEMYESLLPFCL